MRSRDRWELVSMDVEWEKRVLELAGSDDDSAIREFVELIDAAEGRVDRNTSRILLKTFVTDLDYGAQDSVMSVLVTASPDVLMDEISAELPAIEVRAPGWAEVLRELLQRLIREQQTTTEHPQPRR